jgi:hypothetical protein
MSASAALNLRWNSAFLGVQGAQQIARHADVPVFAVLAMIVAVVLLSSVMIVPHTPFWFQPSVRGIITVLITLIVVSSRAAAAHGIDLAEIRARHF